MEEGCKREKTTRGTFHIPAQKWGHSDTSLKCLSTTAQNWSNNHENNASSVRNLWHDQDHGDTVEEHVLVGKGPLIYRGKARMRRRGTTTWLYRVQVWRDHELIALGILRKPKKATRKCLDSELESRLWSSLGIVRQNLLGHRHKDMPRRWDTQRGGCELAMDLEDWIGFTTSAEIPDRYCHKVTFTC